MKHLHLFENKGDTFWIVVFENLEDCSSNFVSLFDDIESAENYYIETVNDLKADFIYQKKHRELLEDEMIVTVEEAEHWIRDVDCIHNVVVRQIINKGTYELPEEFQIIRKSRKYNI